MSQRELVLLSDRFPGLSRMTLFRIAREPGFPTPFIIRNRRYYDFHRVAAVGRVASSHQTRARGHQRGREGGGLKENPARLRHAGRGEFEPLTLPSYPRPTAAASRLA